MTDTVTSSTVSPVVTSSVVTSSVVTSAESALSKFEAELKAEEAKIEAAFKKYLPYVYGFAAGAAVATLVHLIF